jgi:hypothetical protein
VLSLSNTCTNTGGILIILHSGLTTLFKFVFFVGWPAGEQLLFSVFPHIIVAKMCGLRPAHIFGGQSKQTSHRCEAQAWIMMGTGGNQIHT